MKGTIMRKLLILVVFFVLFMLPSVACNTFDEGYHPQVPNTNYDDRWGEIP